MSKAGMITLVLTDAAMKVKFEELGMAAYLGTFELERQHCNRRRTKLFRRIDVKTGRCMAEFYIYTQPDGADGESYRFFVGSDGCEYRSSGAY